MSEGGFLIPHEAALLIAEHENVRYERRARREYTDDIIRTMDRVLEKRGWATRPVEECTNQFLHYTVKKDDWLSELTAPARPFDGRGD